MRFLTRAVALLTSAFGLVAQAQNLSIATGGTGGVYYPLGGGMAAVLSRYVPGMQATAEVTGGSVANLQLIGTGKPYLGMTMADATLDAYKGQDKLIDHAELVPAMNRKYGDLYVQDAIPKDMYRGMDADNNQATVMNLLVAHQNMDEKTAYNIVKAVFDHKEELVRVHKEAENFKLENQKKAASPIPWHPGAVKYFSEKGIKLQ